MLKAAANLTRDLNAPKPAIYWADMLGSALLGYARAVRGDVRCSPSWLRDWLRPSSPCSRSIARASFIHELTHIKKGAVQGFRFAWNLIVGVPLMVPSFMYEGVHNQHHAKRYYGTVDDPEYLPLALMKPWTLPVFLIAAALAPIGMLIRFGILAPLSLLSPKLRTAGRRPLFRPSDQPQVRPPQARRRVRARLGVAGGGVQHLGDRAARDGRDGHHPAARFPDLPRRRVGRDVPQPGPHPGRASVGE